MRYGLGSMMLRRCVRRLRLAQVEALDAARWIGEVLADDPSATIPGERAAWETDRRAHLAKAAEARAQIAWIRANEARRWWCAECAETGYAVLLSSCEIGAHARAPMDPSLRADPRSLVESVR